MLSSSRATASPRLTSTHFNFGHNSGATKGKSGPTPLPSPISEDVPPTLAELALETILCAVVDSKINVRRFEECGGVGAVSQLLRGKVDAGKAAKYVILYFSQTPPVLTCTLFWQSEMSGVSLLLAVPRK